MRAAAMSILLLILPACEQPKPQLPDTRTPDLDIFSITASSRTADTCKNEVPSGDIEALPTRVDQCFEMTSAQRWHGLWRDDFEGSRFCPDAARECSYRSPGNRIWLTFAEHLPEREMKSRGGLYAIDFIGRRTMYAGNFGHLGAFDHEMIVDRVISIREIEAPPPPMTEAEAEAEWKRCEKTGNCISLEKMEKMQEGQE